MGGISGCGGWDRPGAVVKLGLVPGHENGDDGGHDEEENKSEVRNQAQDEGDGEDNKPERNQGEDVGTPTNPPDGGKDGTEAEAFPHTPGTGEPDNADDRKEVHDESHNEGQKETH